MANFDIAFQTSDNAEGGYSKVAGDRGGETYRGISRRYFPNWKGWEIIDQIGVERKISNARFSEIDNLTIVRDFYKATFWDKLMGDKILYQRVAECIYDYAINAGIGDAIEGIQALVGAQKVDRVMGPMTLSMLNSVNDYDFLVDYCMQRMLHYSRLAKSDLSQRKFLRGWWNRVAAYVRWQ